MSTSDLNLKPTDRPPHYPRAEDLSLLSSPESVHNIVEANIFAKQRYATVILRMAASPIHGLLEAVKILLKHAPLKEVLEHGNGIERESFSGSLEEAQEDYAKVLVQFLKVTNKLRVPNWVVLSKFMKQDDNVS